MNTWHQPLGLVAILTLAPLAWASAQTVYAPPFQVDSTGTNPVDFEFRANGVLIAKGNSGVGSLVTADQGAGTRLLWFPSLGAFRAGQVDGIYWNASLIGSCSTAFGFDTKANGNYSLASGYLSYASGDSSVALGKNLQATNTASTAFGGSSYAFGYASAVANNYAVANAGDSTAYGYHTQTGAIASLVLGYNNNGPSITYHYGATDGTSGAVIWSGYDPIFEVGDGYSATATANAMTVFQNGQASFQGALSAPVFMTSAPAGDVLMFGN